ncbi:MAG: M1 family metallopeptidase [Bacteroidota bacterium]|nr:M1 family metallopeptidase [Bacteroidota bacterium]MDP4212409.1 M1 family metallopeptidase [Bacteroidota bacterium]MDP4251267.1 M1 family metallopeptidase [Bacteroidota bacterium]
MKRTAILFIVMLCFDFTTRAQDEEISAPLTHADTLIGSPNPERAFNVLRYDISITPDYESRSIAGKNTITYLDSGLVYMQIDLQEPLIIDSIIYRNRSLFFKREGNSFLAYVGDSVNRTRPCLQCIQSLTVYYHGTPKIAAKPPWDGGWIFSRDSLGRPWMSVACEEAGASIWYPCKDYLGDEPDSGASLSVTVADSLVAIGNGRLEEKTKNRDGTCTWTWAVKSPINNYNIIPYIGKYKTWHTVFNGERGKLDCDFWVLDYQLNKAKKHFSIVDSMLACFEYWFGPYPFYGDGYKLVEAPYLGMEHQSNIAYGNHFRQGYDGHDLSGTGWGMKWDFIIVHESGHEWFGNNITAKDIADEWIHEAFTDYSEALYTAYYFGQPAGDAYVIGLRKRIENKFPVIRLYGVHRGPLDTDEYYKGSNMIHAIRQVINNDSLFRRILRGLNKTFYHKTVTAGDIESYINRASGRNFTPVFNQYLRSTEVPVFEYSLNGDELRYRWTKCNSDFNLPLKVNMGEIRWLSPTTQWQKLKLNRKRNKTLTVDPAFYVGVKNDHDPEPNP